MKNRLTLETWEGAVVHQVEIETDPPDLVIWDGRYFIVDESERGLYTETDQILVLGRKGEHP